MKYKKQNYGIFILILILLILSLSYFIYKSNNKIIIYNKVDLKNLQRGQKLMLEMFKFFDKICRDNNIKYWAIGGILIGAMRHNGWIPWDGDIDIGMLQTDYNKFKELMKKKLPTNMVFEHKPKTKPCSKLRLLNAYYTSSPFGYHWDDYDGLQLDIFVYENNSNEIYGKYAIVGMPDKNRRPYSDIFPLKELPFEGLNIYVPNKYKQISSAVWGGYPPPLLPINKRFPHEGNIIIGRPTNKMIDKYKLHNKNDNKGVITEYGNVVN